MGRRFAAAALLAGSGGFAAVSVSVSPSSAAMPSASATSSTAVATTFDSFTSLRDFYVGLGVDPWVTSGLVDDVAVAGSSASSLLNHDVGVAAAIDAFSPDPLPAYTVTEVGQDVSVCRDDGVCETFSDFVLSDGKLVSLAVDGQSTDEWASESAGPMTVESLTVEASYAVRRPREDVLSVFLELSSMGGGTAFGWELATYVDATGRQFPNETAASELPGFMGEGGLDVAYVTFAGARLGGDLLLPITAVDTNDFVTVRVPVTMPAAVDVSGAGRAPAATAVATTVAGAPVFEPVGFFGDFFAQLNTDPSQLGDLPRRVVTGSPADAWVAYLMGLGAARLESRHGPLPVFTVTASTTAIEGSAAVDVCGDGFCDTFSDFVVTDGRLQSFRLNGLRIDDRLASATKPSTFGAMEISVVGAFERVTVDQLAVVLAVEPIDEELTVDWDDVSYVDASGEAIAVDLQSSAYPDVIGPPSDGREQAVVLQFPTADLGGKVVLTFTTPSSPAPVEARVIVDALRP